MDERKTLLIIPTYNEEESIALLLPQVEALEVSILIVDDGSTDNTIKVIQKFIDSGLNIEVLQRGKKLGLGSAYIDGFALAISRDFDRVIQMDADGSHQVSDLIRLLIASEMKPNSELIIGSRWVKGGKVVNWNKGRQYLSRSANRYSQFTLNLEVKDSTAGFRIYRTSLLKRMQLKTIRSEGFSFQIEMTKRAVEQGAVITEIPITFIERAYGKSKMSKKIIIEAMVRVTFWGVQRIFRK
jgi:dolichol-phosphate mannosyltransferase